MTVADRHDQVGIISPLDDLHLFPWQFALSTHFPLGKHSTQEGGSFQVRFREWVDGRVREHFDLARADQSETPEPEGFGAAIDCASMKILSKNRNDMSLAAPKPSDSRVSD